MKKDIKIALTTMVILCVMLGAMPSRRKKINKTRARKNGGVHVQKF